MENIYGLQDGVCGVYLMTCNINNKQYIGSSTDISGRLSTHFGRETRLYPYKPLYIDIVEYGRDNFTWTVLEECDRSELIAREQYYYDIIKPEYNQIRPNNMNKFNSKECEERIKEGNKKTGKSLSKLYSDENYKELFKEINRYKFIPVVMIDLYTNEEIMYFECMGDAERWLNNNSNYKSKNKVSKIRECCHGTRKSAFGYKWKFKD